MQIAKACAGSVTMSPVQCCGMAGDRGMRFPEISGVPTIPSRPDGHALELVKLHYLPRLSLVLCCGYPEISGP